MTLQTEITNWAKETFGGWTNSETLFERLKSEVEELEGAVYSESKEDIVEECADVLHLLFQLCDKQGFDLINATKIKFEINKNRKWKVTGNGIGQHTE